MFRDAATPHLIWAREDLEYLPYGKYRVSHFVALQRLCDLPIRGIATSSLYTCNSLMSMRMAAALVEPASVAMSSTLNPGLDTNSGMNISFSGIVGKIPAADYEFGMGS